MEHSEAEDAGGLTPAKDDNAAMRPLYPRAFARNSDDCYSSDQIEFFFLGANLCAVIPLSSFLVVLSIQPKHMASSTASTYQKVPSSIGLPRLTTTQHSAAVL